MNRWTPPAVPAATFALFVITGLHAAEQPAKPDKKPAPVAVAVDAKPATQPAYLDEKHAPKGKGWIKLFNGKNLRGWKSFPDGRPSSWKVEDGKLVSTFKEGEHGTNVFTEKKFEDFEIYYEYLVPKEGNSGVFLRGQYEIQIQDDHGQPADKPRDWGNGGIYGQKAPSKNASKPTGQWQSVYATMIGKKITVYLNGEKIIDGHEPPRPTHLYGELGVKAGDPAGPIVLQGDHRPIQFRYVMLRPITKKPSSAAADTSR